MAQHFAMLTQSGEAGTIDVHHIKLLIQWQNKYVELSYYETTYGYQIGYVHELANTSKIYNTVQIGHMNDLQNQ